MANNNLHAIARRRKLIELPDGKKIEIAALTLSDLAFLQEEAAAAARRELIETYAKNAEYIPAAKRDEVVLDAFKRAEEIRVDTIEAVRVTSWMNLSLRGRLCAIWLSMRASLPNLTYDQAAEIWSDAQANDAQVDAAAEEVGKLTKSTLGNGSPPPVLPEAEGATLGAAAAL